MVRIYCLASISQISPSDDYYPPVPYNDDADEVVLNTNGCHDILRLDTFSSDYSLTEICIGWKAVGDGTKKVYELQLYRPNGILLSFRMVRGMATVESMDLNNGSFELHLAISKFFTFSNLSSPNFDLRIQVIFIKNTTVRKIITNEEELAYNDYAKRIASFCSNNTANYPHLTMEDLQLEAIQQLGPLTIQNQSRPKFLRQKLRDFQQAVHLLCNPVDGSFANIPVNEYDPETKKSKVCRFYQQVECLLYLRQSTFSLRKMDYAFQNLRAIDFDNVDLGESLKYWHCFAANVNFKEITSISMHNCGIRCLNDEFFEYLSRDTLQCLSFINNDIKYISTKIQKLQPLSILDLSNNKNLSENEIPWTSMAPNLVDFNLENTNIKIIPEEIWWLKSLSYFKVSSLELKSINWQDFNKHINKLSIIGGGNEVNEVELGHVDVVEELAISNLKLNRLDYSNLPKCLSSLRLIDTHLGTFNTHDVRCSNGNFNELMLSGNELTEFSWEGCPREIKRLILSNNQLQDVSVRDNTLSFRGFTELTEISFESNKINSLPEGFENLQQLCTLNLGDNCFNYDEMDMMKVLWHRLPKTIISLNLSNNSIVTIPCLLKDFTLRNLRVAGCNLRYCCPYLHTHVQNKGEYLFMDASNNLNFSLSFIPSTIYKLPKVSEIKQVIGKPLYNGNLIPNYAGFPTTTVKGNLSDTSKTLYSKAGFKFSSDEIEQNDSYSCKCCGMCGNATEELLFQQQLSLDSILLIQEEEGKEDTKTTTYHSNFKPPIYYKPGQWRTEIKSRLCCGCKKLIFDKINKTFENKTKKKKNNNKNLNENIQEEVSHELPRKYNNQAKALICGNRNAEAMEYESQINPILPPIETLYPANEGYYNNISTSTNSFSLPQTFERTVLIDHDGKECARWEHPYSACSSNYPDSQYYAQAEVHYQPANNYILTDLNELTTISEDQNLQMQVNYFDFPESLPSTDEMLSWCNL